MKGGTMEDKKEFSFSDGVIDIDEIEGLDTKINPDTYIHFGILRIQQVLAEAKDDAGFMKYIIMVGHLESLCKAGNYLPTDYEAKLKEFTKTEEYSKTDKDFSKQMKYNNKKVELMLENVFSKKPLKSPLKM